MAGDGQHVRVRVLVDPHDLVDSVLPKALRGRNGVPLKLAPFRGEGEGKVAIVAEGEEKVAIVAEGDEKEQVQPQRPYSLRLVRRYLARELGVPGARESWGARASPR